MKSSEIEAVKPTWDDLASIQVAVPVHATELEDLTPSHIVEHHFDGPRLHLDLVYEGPNGTPTRVALVLDPTAPRPAVPTSTDGVGQYLPDTDTPEVIDLPPWGYGVIGVCGGAVMGLLLSYVSGLL
jgi:hypothetical protein